MGYSSGDTVVHPRHGVAKVTGTSTRGTRDAKRDYIELLFELKGMTIMVPVDSIDEIGIRGIASAQEAKEILALLEEDSDVSTVWSERNADTLSRVKSTELPQAAMVIRDLTRHADRLTKPLSPAEATTLKTCLDMVTMELSLSLGMSEDETRDLILSKVGVKDDASA